MKKIFSFALMLIAMASCSTQENLPLEGYVWKLTEMEGIPTEAIEADAEFFILRFDAAESIASGRSNCNTFFGEYTLNDKGLFFDSMGATKMLCPNHEQEQAYFEMFGKVDNYSIEGDVLTLKSKGAAIATFKMQSMMEAEVPVEAAAQEECCDEQAEDKDCCKDAE